MDTALRELVKGVLLWWEEHRFDYNCTDGEEYNTYNMPPSFVLKAQELNDQKLCATCTFFYTGINGPLTDGCAAKWGRRMEEEDPSILNKNNDCALHRGE